MLGEMRCNNRSLLSRGWWFDSHNHEEGAEFQDAHEREHAEDIERRFGNQAVTTPQIAVFGFTGGLLPCPAAFSVLVICFATQAGRPRGDDGGVV